MGTNSEVKAFLEVMGGGGRERVRGLAVLLIFKAERSPNNPRGSEPASGVELLCANLAAT